MGPDEDREQRLHDLKMKRLAEEDAVLAKLRAEVQHNYEVAQQAMKDRGEAIEAKNAMVERLKRHSEERDHYRSEVQRLNLQVDGLQKALDSMLCLVSQSDEYNDEQCPEEYKRRVKVAREVLSNALKRKEGS